jgi:tRNA threonylcarbamoyladenosine biosynthesis protein TsaE
VNARLVARSQSAAQTRRVGEALGAAARPGDTFLLEGAFGVGKTVLVQGIATGLGVPGPVTSPSFVLMVQHQGRLPLFHVDLYRLDGRLDDEMLETLEDAEDAGGVCAIEWPTGLPADLQAGATHIRIEAIDDDTRELIVESPHSRIVETICAALEGR